MLTELPASSVAGLAGAAAVTVTVCLNADRLGRVLCVMAHPDLGRRRHAVATPQIGGLAILVGLLAWIVFDLFTDASANAPLLRTIAFGALGVGAIGFADDQKDISPTSRVFMLLAFVGIALMADHDFIARRLNWGSFEPSHIPAWAYLPLLGIASAGIVNAVNMADGQNGVVGTMFAAWSLCLMMVASGTGAAISAVLFVLSLIFLGFNLMGRLFLGDCGSYGVTFVIGLLAAYAHAKGQVSLETVIVWFFLPVMDCLRLLICRPLRGLSPFHGDRDHFHHRLEDKLGRVPGLISYTGAVVVSSLVATLEPRFALVCLCILSAYYFSFAWTTTANVAVPDQTGEDALMTGTDNVVPISRDDIVNRRQNSL